MSFSESGLSETEIVGKTELLGNPSVRRPTRTHFVVCSRLATENLEILHPLTQRHTGLINNKQFVSLTKAAILFMTNSKLWGGESYWFWRERAEWWNEKEISARARCVLGAFFIVSIYFVLPFIVLLHFLLSNIATLYYMLPYIFCVAIFLEIKLATHFRR